jgi:hypothetical protein
MRMKRMDDRVTVMHRRMIQDGEVRLNVCPPSLDPDEQVDVVGLLRSWSIAVRR